MAAFAALRRAWISAGGRFRQAPWTSSPLRWPQAGGRLAARGGGVALLRPAVRCQSSAAVAGTQIAAAAATPLVEQGPLPLTELVPDATLAELDLGGYSPVGLIMRVLESLHLDLGLPWWGAIVAGTVLIRCLVFPLMVKHQQNAVMLHNHMPQITVLSARINEAKKTGNSQQFMKAVADLDHYQKTHDVNPLRGFITPFVQAPIFISFFLALRKMAEFPVPSMQTGGLGWFADLTAADPYYVLPLMTTVSMWIILEAGMEAGAPNPNLDLMKKVFRVMPVLFLPFIISFPTAIFTYWLTSNLFSIMQVLLFRLPAIRTFFHIPERMAHRPECLPPQDDFLKSMKKGWKNIQIAHQLKEREQYIKKQMDSTQKGSLHQTFSQKPQKRQLG